MCDKLPVGGFKWVKVVDYVNNTEDDYGFIVQVYLKYPKHLHDAHNAYPLAPERLNGKLIPNLDNKTKYVLNYKALQTYESLGLVVTRFHKVLRFKQRAWLKPYIKFNINKRKLAKVNLK